MPVLGVVMTHPDPASLSLEIQRLPLRIRAGEPVGGRLPLALDVPDPDIEPALSLLRSLPGVLALDLAFSSFETDLSDEVSP